MPEPLSKMERRILEYLVDYLKKNTYQPSIREIGKRFGIKSTKTVSEYLQSLADKGYIEREASRSRGVKILGLELARPAVVSVPFYGKVAAGEPILRRDFIRAEYGVDSQLGASPNAFFLQVEGDSMEGMGILDGDMVLIEPAEQKTLKDGDVVAAQVDGQATVKRFFSRGEETILEPASPGHAPMLVNGQDLAVLGKVIGLFRRFQAREAVVA